MTSQQLYEDWKKEEAAARMEGWDFSRLRGRYEEGQDIPWDYDAIVRACRRDEMQLLDYDTGGGEYLLTLGHPAANTAATEGWPPNVALCQKRLIPLGIRFAPCADPAAVPFADGSFDLILNRHGDFVPCELYRLLRPGGIFITQQVGAENDRDLVEQLLPGLAKPFPAQTLAVQRAAFEEAGFSLLRGEEHFGRIRFYDIGALVWFARIIEWEFPGFSVDRCRDALLRLHRQLAQTGVLEGTTHRFLIAAQKIGVR